MWLLHSGDMGLRISLSKAVRLYARNGVPTQWKAGCSLGDDGDIIICGSRRLAGVHKGLPHLTAKMSFKVRKFKRLSPV